MIHVSCQGIWHGFGYENAPPVHRLQAARNAFFRTHLVQIGRGLVARPIRTRYRSCRVRAINFRFVNFAELVTLVEAGQEEQDIPLAKCCGTFSEGEWVLVNFTVGGPQIPCSEMGAPNESDESTAIAGQVVDRGNGLRIAFEDRDWDTLYDFALEQPVQSAPPSIPPPPTAETVSVIGTTVMLVDSDRDTQAVVSALLKTAGYEVLLASSAEAAFESLRGARVDLVVLEWSLPGMSGLQFCERIRNDRRLGELPVMFLSTHSSTERQARAFEAGADDYVTKPFREAELSARIACLLRRTRLARSA